MIDDDPLDLSAVALDHAAVEALVAGADGADDEVLALLRDLLDDVTVDLPDVVDEPLPVGCGSTVLPLANEQTPERRLVRGGTLVAIVAAGVLSLGGVAAASTVVSEGSPLHGLGEVVRSAAGAVVGAVTPPESAPAPRGAAPAEDAAPAPQAEPAPAAQHVAPGAVVSAAAQSQAAARQVTALLDAAERLLDAGRAKAADARLDNAEAKLAAVLPADGAAALRERLVALRERADVAAAPRQKQQKAPEQPAAKKQQPAGQQPPAPAPAKKQQAPKQDPPAPAADEQPPAEQEPESGPGKGGGNGKGGDSGAGQSASEASAKPRA